MQDKVYSGQDGCRTGRMQDDQMRDKTGSEPDGCRTGQMQYRMDAGQDRCSKGRMQDKSDRYDFSRSIKTMDPEYN